MMRILLIRHSIALERTEWDSDDLLRPLADRGKEVANDFFKKMPKVYRSIDVIISSKATRAIQTADLLGNNYSGSRFEVEELLNPGCTPDAFREILQRYQEVETIAFVGHEPDFSEITANLLGVPTLPMRLRKPSIVDIEWDENGQGILRNLISPKVFKKFRLH